MKRIILTIGICIAFFEIGYGQILTFENSGLSGNEASTTSNSNDTNIASSTLSRGSGINASNNGGRFNANSHSTESTLVTGDNSYFTFNINPNSGFSFSVTDIEFNFQRSSTGPKSFALRSSNDSFASNLGSVVTISDVTSTQTLTFTFSLTNITSNTEFRLYTYNAESTSGSGGIGDGSGNDIVVNGSTTSTGGVASKLVVTQINSGNSPSVGTAFDVVVQTQDASDTPSNVSSDVNVTLTKATGTGTLGGTLTGTISSGSNSVTISGVTFDTNASGISITASDDASSLTSGTSSTFNVLTASDQLVLVSVPTIGYTNTALSEFTVEARRSGDNSVDLNYTKSITLSIATGTGTIGGTTSQSSTNGVATFNDITIDAAGSFTIEATDGSLTSTASSDITISAATIVINEIMADPTGIDSNGDGTVDTSEDEYIEFVNTSDSNLDISSWTIEDGSGLRHTFPASTILQPLQAVVVFGGGVPTGNFGDALVFTASLGLNNTGDDVILKDDQGAIVVSYTYGSEGGDDQSITRSPDLTGTFAKHTAADTDDSSSFSPGTKLDGSTFQASTNLSGLAGFRLLSAPSAESYGDLLDNLWTQGASAGADVTNGDPNVYIWDNSSTGNTNTHWSGLTDLTGTITAGEGFLVYVFADDDLDGVNDAFPKLVSSFGAENAADASPTINSNADGWTLLGNPFNSTIDFDNLTTNDITDVAYVYDPATTWLSWNGSIGDLTDGLVAPFQGFFVQTASSPTSASVSFPAAAKTTGGSFYGKVAKSISYLRLEVEGEEVSNSAWIQLSPEGSATSKVYGDALELQPLSPKYAQLGFIKGSEVMDIAHIAASEEIILPIEFNSTEGGTFKISSTDFTIPTDFEVRFHDYQQEVTMVMDGSFSYSFETEGLKNKDVPVLSVLNAGAMPFKSTESNRFGITIRPTSVSSEIGDIPLLFGLDQNYPNPFNPSTTIGYSIQEAGAVSISVYNLMGQKVATLVDEHKSAGQHNIRWNAAGVSSGMYYYRLEANGKALTRKMTLIK